MSFSEKYEAVIGLEVHAQLQTNSKLFCGDGTSFGSAPNSQVSPITLGHPGTLPKTNRKAVEYAIKMGLACGCEIEQNNYFARKNYFYPDLPKGYQISQHTTPICKGGRVHITTSTGSRDIQLNRIHLEEDAGKSIHDLEDQYTCIDLNRAGTPLIEIVTEPDLHSAEEAWHYVTEIRKLVQWLGICDGNMEEGSLRCDANISIRLKGDQQLGTKVEVKNLNSIRNVRKAIEFEITRLIELAERGESIKQQTRSFNAANDTTFAIRDKEEANDYRYFPDPDLAPFHLTEAYIANIREALPELPQALANRLIETYGLGAYDVQQICESIDTVRFFERTAQHTSHFKAIANWMLGPVRQHLNETNLSYSTTQLTPNMLAQLVDLVQSEQVNFSVASSKLLPLYMEGSNKTPSALAAEMNLIQVTDGEELENWVNTVLQQMPDKVSAYKKGKKGLIGLFMGEVKRLSKGKADPRMTTTLLEEKLKQ